MSLFLRIPSGLFATSLLFSDHCSVEDLPKPKDDASECIAVDRQEVVLKTLDGVELKARYYASGVMHAPAVVLLHMIPPRFDYNSYPEEFISALISRGIDVININRRGAKGSGGVAVDAYKGHLGWLDALAGVEYLLSTSCRNDRSKIGFIGASNGTTTMLDYTMQSINHPALDIPTPASLVYLSGGSYSENQYKIEANYSALAAIPSVIVYPTTEAEWNDGVRTIASNNGNTDWVFWEYDSEAHGTTLFETEPPLIGRLVEHLGHRLKGLKSNQ